MKKLGLIYFLFWTVLPVLISQNVDTTFAIPELEITALKSVKPTKVFTISKIDSNTIVGPPVFSINELLNNVAGIFSMAGNNFAQDSRLSSRGFGSRAAFGIRGIKIIVDDIPSSSPDGQAQLDDVDFAMLHHMEMVKGPSAGIFGNSSGGVLNLTSNPFLNENSFKVGTYIGSFGRKQVIAAANLANERGALTFNFNRSVLDGYRGWSEYENNIFTIRGKLNLTGQSSLTANISYLNNPIANDPGAVNEEELALGRRKPRDRNEFYRAGETVKQIKSSLIYGNYFSGPGIALKAKVFLIKRNFENFLPFEVAGAVAIDRVFGGVSFDLTKTFTLKSNTLQFLLGGELEHQRDERSQFTNIRGVSLGKSFDQDESFKNVGLYLLTNLNMKNKFNIDVNLRFDRISTSADDNFLSNGDQSASLVQNVLNPAVAMKYKISKVLSLGSVFSTGFENPTLNELSNNPNGSGGFNIGLLPMKSINYELNMQFNTRKLSGQMALFHIKTSNEIIAYELPNQTGRSYYRNAGSTSRSGIEVDLNYCIHKNLRIRSNHSFSRFIYDEYLSFNGNTMPGLPQVNSNLNLEYQFNEKITVFFDNNYVSEIKLNDANTISTPEWLVSNIRGNYHLKFYNQVFDIFIGVNNLFNASYFSNLRINAAGNRFFEAAPTRSYHFGFTYSYTKPKKKTHPKE